MMRLCSLLLALCALTACEGKAGPTGPQGPAGPQGATGATGLPGNVGALDLIEHTVASDDYTTGSAVLILDRRISLDSYLGTYVFAPNLPFPAYLDLPTYGEQQIGDTATHPYVAVFTGGLYAIDPDRALLGQTIVVAVLPE